MKIFNFLVIGSLYTYEKFSALSVSRIKMSNQNCGLQSQICSSKLYC